MKIKKLILISVVGLILVGCQSGSTIKTNQQTQPNNSQNAGSDYGKPYSNGPLDQADSTGPLSMPPADESLIIKRPTAEAVTTNENIRLTLPLKTN